MSGQATGWVLRHGPRPDDVDRSGVAYGLARARALRAVLLPIADAANRDGEQSHPGRSAIEEGSLYSRASVTRVLADLADEGWIDVVSEGGGRGKAAEYRVRFERRERAHYEPVIRPNPARSEPVPETETGSSGELNRLTEDAKPAHIEQKPAHGHSQNARPTVLTTVNPNGTSNASLVLLGDDALEPSRTFDDFWTAWPRRDGKKLHRGKAEEVWRRMTAAEREAATVGARHLSEAVAAGGRFGVPDAFRWLRDRSWVDWQEPADVRPQRQERRSVGDDNLARLRSLGRPGVGR